MVSDWISVYDELPKNRQSVNIKGYKIGTRKPVETTGFLKKELVNILDDVGLCFSLYDCVITHWKPSE